MGELLEFIPRIVNGAKVEQRNIDGFINATAMCTAHNKKIDSWFRTKEVFQLFIDLSVDLDPNFNYSNLSNLDAARLSAKKYSLIFPFLLYLRVVLLTMVVVRISVYTVSGKKAVYVSDLIKLGYGIKYYCF